MRRPVLVSCLSLVLCLGVGTSVAMASGEVVMAAGDVACNSTGITTPGACSQRYTANLALQQQQTRLDALLAMGDLQYDSGALSAFQKYFGTSWGVPALRGVLHPAPGNHEYLTSGASGYFDYFSSIGVRVGARGQGWYSFDVGSWHFVALNSSNACSPVSCAAGSAQETWLRSDLAATRQPCIGAFWHHPLSSVPKLKDLWQDLQNVGADAVFDGHVHGYKDLAPHDASGRPDPNGMREFVAGSGGKSSGVYGLLKLTLGANGADYRFVGSGASDSGSITCHGTPQQPAAPTAAFGSSTAGLTATFTDKSTGSPTSWSWTFGDGSTSTAQNPTHTYAQPGSYQVTLTATNATGSTSTTHTVTVTQGSTTGNSLTFTPSGDASVKDTSPTSNYGTLSTLRVRQATSASPTTYHSYLTFNVSGLSAPVTGVKLRLYVTDPSPDTGTVFSTSNAWAESAITWNNAPAPAGPALGSLGSSTSAGAWTQVDLGPGAVTANGTYSFVLQSGSTNSALFSSREGTNPPQLIVTTG